MLNFQQNIVLRIIAGIFYIFDLLVCCCPINALSRCLTTRLRKTYSPFQVFFSRNSANLGNCSSPRLECFTWNASFNDFICLPVLGIWAERDRLVTVFDECMRGRYHENIALSKHNVKTSVIEALDNNWIFIWRVLTRSLKQSKQGSILIHHFSSSYVACLN